MNLGLGILSPCLVFHPESQVLLITSLISALVHSMLCLSLLIIKRVGNHFQESADDFIVLGLVAGLIFSLVPSCFLHWMSFDENRQKFGLITRLGSLCCENEDAFIWACENNYPSLLEHSKKYLMNLLFQNYLKNPSQLMKNKKGELGFFIPLGKNNAVHVACIKGKLNHGPKYLGSYKSSPFYFDCPQDSTFQ